MGGLTKTPRASAAPRTTRGRLLLAVAVAGLTLASSPTLAAAPAAPPVMMPTGGGYEVETLDAFGKAAVDRATDATVDLVVVPSAYGDDLPSRAENIALARERTAEIAAACTAVVTPGKRCVGRLAILLNRQDALRAANSAALRDASLDGIYVLGGDQGIAMKVLANSPAEEAMAAAVRAGVVLAGTSAGAAVESRSMINGYRGDFGPAQGLRRGSTLMWWGDGDDPQRGLVFGSQRAIYDQHFYQRGRFGRSLSTIAAADERLGGKSPVGVGVDYATGVVNYADRQLTQVFGQSGVGIIDFESLGATHRWVGTEQWLSARRVKVNLLTENTSYDLRTRVLTRGGDVVGQVSGRSWTAPTAAAGGVLYLGGGVLGGNKVINAFIADASDTGAENSRVLVLAADTRGTATAYADKVKQAGWRGHLDIATFGRGNWADIDPARYAAVLLVAVSPTQSARAFADSRFQSLVRKSLDQTPAVFADGPAAAYLGARWSPQSRPNGDDYEDKAVAAFRVDEASWRPGIGAVNATIVPAINTDYQWGRVFNAVAVAPGQLALGVSAGSAVRFGAGAPRVVDGSVVVIDGRDAVTWAAANGTLGAAGLVLDTFGPGETLRR